MTISTPLLFIITLPAVLNLPSKVIVKRSPLDIRSTSFDNVPRLYIPQNGRHDIPLALAPVLAPHTVTRFHHGIGMSKVKGPNVDHSVQRQLLTPVTHLYPQAVSNVHKVSVHTNVKHFVTKDNLKIPVLTHTISHSSSNITHPVKAVLLPVHPTHIFVPIPKPLLVLHDTSVIPLRIEHTRRHQNLVSVERQDRQRSEPITADSDDDIQSERNPIGGFGTGFRYGGHGAGHGYFAYG